MKLVECRDLSKVFSGGVRALEKIELSVDRGEFLTILGPSGSGKSTLLRLIAGLETPTSGEIRIAGRSAETLAPRDRDIAFVFQNPALFPHLNIFDNMAFGLRARRAARAEVQTRVEEAAALLGIADLLKRKPGQLSGGERQRAALGRAIAGRPEILLLDEPLSNLDAPLRASIRTDLERLRTKLPSTFIFVTHDQAEALSLGDRVMVLDRGRIEQTGGPRELLEQPVSLFVSTFMGSPPSNAFPCLIIERGGRLSIQFEEFDGVLDAPVGSPIGAVVLCLRPESIVVDGSSELRGEIVRLEPLGHETIGTVSLGSRTIQIRLAARTSLARGETIGVRFDLAQALWFSRESGKAISRECQESTAFIAEEAENAE